MLKHESYGLRLDQKTCNAQQCVGDETCITKHYVIVLMGARGSLKEDGVAILGALIVNLFSRYQAKYFRADAMKLGLAGVGHGRLNSLPDGTTSTEGANHAQGLICYIA